MGPELLLQFPSEPISGNLVIGRFLTSAKQSKIQGNPMMSSKLPLKTRMFMIIGWIGVTVGAIALRRHLDFVSGFGIAFGTGALIFFIRFMRREPRLRE